MLPKVIGYGGFQSYGQKPYPSLKSEQNQSDFHQIWKHTVRSKDNPNTLNNFNYNKTVYHKSYLQNTKPQDYNTGKIVVKGTNGKETYNNYFNSQIIKQEFCRQECPIDQNTGKKIHKPQCPLFLSENGKPISNMALTDPLITGCEHWNTLYKNDYQPIKKQYYPDIIPRKQKKQIPQTKLAGGDISGEIKYDVKMGDINEKGKSEGQDQGKSGMAFSRSIQPQWSKFQKMYSVKCKVPTSEYKFKYGEKIGHCPNPHIMDKYSTKQPKIFDDLKMGTTQMTSHIPGYQGFLPAARTIGKALQQSQGANTRTTWLKNNIIQNYHLNIPGYMGYKTSSYMDMNLRESCFNLKKQNQE